MLLYFEIFRKEFSKHGLAGLVTVEHKDVIKDGFGLKHVADAGKIHTCDSLLQFLGINLLVERDLNSHFRVSVQLLYQLSYRVSWEQYAR